ncbi:MAG: outer membrane beta-barrel protein [Alphaproteobacteria bacterium]|nr:outer membrane beta-barrel protein [Alphaproteobacteria bacterium]
MKRFLGGFVAICAVLVCDRSNAVCGDAAGCQTIRMTPGTPQVVSNTFTMDGGCSSGGCVNTSVNGGPRYVVGAPVVSSGYVQRGYVPVQPVYRQPTSYQRTNYVAAPNNVVTNTRTMTYQQSRPVGASSGTSGAYVYNKGGAGYVGMNLDINLLNWRNEYKALPVAYNEAFNHDDYRFKPLIGGHIVAGYRFNPGWRMDIEGGFTSEFEDSDNGLSFKLSVPYVTANLYHDFTNGLYIGGGAGVAFPTISMEWEHFTSNDSSKTGTSFMGAAMIGYTYYLSENLILDVRYRFAGFKGPQLTRGVTGWSIDVGDQEIPLESVETSVGFIMDNSISIGLKYEF